MKSGLAAVVLSAILVSGTLSLPAYAMHGDGGSPNDPIMLQTDKLAYGAGETVMVSGSVKDLYSGTPITIQVSSALGTRVALDQVQPGDDKHFSSTVAIGSGWKQGEYTILATYGSNNRQISATFTVGEGGITTPPSSGGPDSIIVPGSNGLSITYEITGGRVLSVTPVQNGEESGSLIFTIDATSDGQLTVNLNNDIMTPFEQDDFFILVDGEESAGASVTGETGTSRTITVPFLAGSSEIEIIGMWVVPEFGTVAVMILAVAIISIVAITSRSRLSLSPRV